MTHPGLLYGVDLVVVDALTGLMGLHSLNGMHTQDVETFYRDVLLPLTSYWAAVLVLDHPPKTGDGSKASGSERKLTSAYTTYSVATDKVPLRRNGPPSTLRLVCEKDRGGYVAWEWIDSKRIAAEVRLSPQLDGSLQTAIERPARQQENATGAASQPGNTRTRRAKVHATGAAGDDEDKIRAALGRGPMSGRALIKAVGARHGKVMAAVERMTDAGEISRDPQGGGITYRLTS